MKDLVVCLAGPPGPYAQRGEVIFRLRHVVRAYQVFAQFRHDPEPDCGEIELATGAKILLYGEEWEHVRQLLLGMSDVSPAVRRAISLDGRLT